MKDWFIKLLTGITFTDIYQLIVMEMSEHHPLFWNLEYYQDVGTNKTVIPPIKYKWLLMGTSGNVVCK